MEELITNNQRFFELITSAIENAKKTIDCEVYILANDETGGRIFCALMAAADRGVKVRLVVDGVGSSAWIAENPLNDQSPNLAVKVYHPIPFLHHHHPLLDKLQLAKQALTRLNRRNHKKLIIIDNHEAFSGSHNYWDNSLTWNEVGVRLTGACDALNASFEFSWRRASSPNSRHPSPTLIRFHSKPSESIQSNLTYRTRRRFLKHLLQRIKNAQQRIWLITPYFVPPKSLLTSLCNAARQGKDVRIVLPLKSDHTFMRLAARYYYPKLINCGVKIYEYEPQMLHAKLFMTDNWAALGSTNLNHRSFFYDLELLITLHERTSRSQLTKLFQEVFQSSRQIDRRTGFTQSLLESLISRVIFTFRKWI